MDEELEHKDLVTKSLSSLLLLISRSGYMQIISMVGVFLLTVFLGAAEFGLFFVVNEIVGIMGYFSDVGLAASLIQKKTQPSLEAVRTSFTIQMSLVLTISGLVILAGGWIGNYYHLDQTGMYLLWALVVSFVLSSLKTIPSVLLERKLQFDRLVIVETAEALLFYGVAVFMAWQGMGVISYVWAVLARSIVGVILIYWLAPWPVGIAFELDEIKDLFKFGIPYQGNTLIAMVKDRLLNVVLAGWIGITGMGYLGWAQTWSQRSLRFVSDNVTKVTFPAFSRMQDDRQKLGRSVEQMLFFSSVIIFPILVGTGVMVEPVSRLLTFWNEELGQQVSYYDKWHVAFFALYFYLYNSAWASISTPISNTLAAVGRITTVSKLMVMWTILTWGIIAPMGYWYGFNGVAVGVSVVATFSIVPIVILKRYVPYNFLAQVLPPALASLGMGVGVYAISRYLPLSWIMVGLAMASGVILYIGLLAMMSRKRMLATWVRLRTHYFQK